MDEKCQGFEIDKVASLVERANRLFPQLGQHSGVAWSLERLLKELHAELSKTFGQPDAA